MGLGWPIARRVAFAVIAAYLVVSVVFAFVAVAPTTNTGWIKWTNIGGSDGASEEVAAYKEARNLDEPLLDRYADWLVDVTTLDWGEAYGGVGPGTPGMRYEAGTPVTSLVGSALAATLRYVVPAMVIAVVGGIAIGLYTATHQHTLLDRLGTSVAYLGFSVPNFWIAQILLLFVLGAGVRSGLGLSPGTIELLRTTVFPALVLTTSLLAGQMRYARAQSLEYRNSEFIKLVRAKGADGWRVARHLLRNAALPLFSLFFTEMLGLVVLNVFVIEYVFGIPGLGGLSLFAYQEQDLPVILGSTMVIVLFGVAGNLLQDVAYLALDPRVEE
ncbi:ABC transporter permease [Halococcus agarilyticus]|uniref:ABC transporter permease n=1 Tax=Halococcus agarilyticus TaxID=1232219 RepID=UPI000677C466|nr:ABC transporter permease [Halococcus agarilyticus]